MSDLPNTYAMSDSLKQVIVNAEKKKKQALKSGFEESEEEEQATDSSSSENEAVDLPASHSFESLIRDRTRRVEHASELKKQSQMRREAREAKLEAELMLTMMNDLLLT